MVFTNKLFVCSKTIFLIIRYVLLSFPILALDTRIVFCFFFSVWYNFMLNIKNPQINMKTLDWVGRNLANDKSNSSPFTH